MTWFDGLEHRADWTEADLVSLALALGASESGGRLSAAEKRLIAATTGITVSPKVIEAARQLILAGEDPLGEMFSVLRSPEARRESGATYTPPAIVNAMIEWAEQAPSPGRIVDPGVGSARFLLAAGRKFSDATLVGIDVDPLAAMMARANLAVAGLGLRSRIVLGDFRTFDENADGSTLFIGNPPYVRHHQIEARWKDWLSVEAVALGLTASKLAGLHVYFFLATARRAKPKDRGAFVTAAEWLDVNYGALVRSLVLGRLGGESITVIEPKAMPFPDAATTAAITTFEIDAAPRSVYFRRVETMDTLGTVGRGREVNRDRLAAEARWSHLTRVSTKPPEGFIELGEICRVHRGTVTGANDVWIAGAHSEGLPDAFMFPSVTRARDVLDSGGSLADATKLRNVIDLPADLDTLDKVARKLVDKFLKRARQMGANRGYVASHRKAWWSVGLRPAAPIIATYMARRPPGFAMNQAGARHINIAHGLYPREEMSEELKQALVRFLQSNISQDGGRTYAGGLTKFEPREMERLFVPAPHMLAEVSLS